MQLVDVIQSIRRHWRVSVGILLLTGVGLGAFLFTRSEVRDPDRWRGAVQVLVPARDKDGVRPEGVPPSLLQGQGVVALSPETTGAALADSEISASDDVAFGFEESELGDILTLSVTAPTPEQALRLADSYAEAYMSARQASVSDGSDGRRTSSRYGLEVLQARLAQVGGELEAIDPSLLALVAGVDASTADEALDLPNDASLDAVLLAEEHRELVARIDATQRTYAEAAIDALLPQSFATTVEREIPVQITPELPSPLIPIAVAVAVGLLLAVAVPVVMDRLDHTIRDPRVAARALSAPVLSTIPASSSAALTTLATPGSVRDSAYRRLAAASIATDELPRAIVVTSPVGYMQDSVAANFAAALAGLGLRVALVATDARQSWYAATAEEDGALTLPDYLATAHAGRLNGHIQEGMMTTPLDNLRVIPHGAAGANELLDGLPPLLQALADADIDVTVIAAPAMLEESTTTILAWSTRSVLWVVESGEVTEHEARDAAEQLALAGATPFGVAVVDGTG